MSTGLPGGSDTKESTCNEGDPSLIPGVGRSPGEGNVIPLHLLGKSHGQKNLGATVHGVAKSQIQLSDFISMSTKVCLVKAMVYPVVMCGCESWIIKKAEHQRIDAFELWCWRRLLRVPWTAGRSHQSILKEISPEYSLEGRC